MRVSVVVTIVEGGESLRRCLDALSRQTGAPELEVLVPYDDTEPNAPAMGAAVQMARFIPMGRVPTAQDPATPRGRHELFDRRRARGLAEATGDVIAILEDRGIPTPDWASTLARLHSELPHAVIGGAVENGIDRLANWAVYFCDFGRYQRPFEAGTVTWVTDVNVGYKRSALLATRELWRERYHEPIVHGALMSRGETLFLTPELVVQQFRTETATSTLLRERFDWGRLFAYTRVKSASPLARVVWCAAAPVIPLVLFVRHAKLQWRKGHFRQFLAAAPLVAVLLMVWGAGEAVGYLTGTP